MGQWVTVRWPMTHYFNMLCFTLSTVSIKSWRGRSVRGIRLCPYNTTCQCLCLLLRTLRILRGSVVGTSSLRRSGTECSQKQYKHCQWFSRDTTPNCWNDVLSFHWLMTLAYMLCTVYMLRDFAALLCACHKYICMARFYCVSTCVQ